MSVLILRANGVAPAFGIGVFFLLASGAAAAPGSIAAPQRRLQYRRFEPVRTAAV